MDLGIAGRVALVMGASQGIGLGIAGRWRGGRQDRDGEQVAGAAGSRGRPIDGETATFVADTADLERLAALPGEVAAIRVAGRDLGHEHGRAAARRGAGASTEEWEDAYRSLAPRRGR